MFQIEIKVLLRIVIIIGHDNFGLKTPLSMLMHYSSIQEVLYGTFPWLIKVCWLSRRPAHKTSCRQIFSAGFSRRISIKWEITEGWQERIWCITFYRKVHISGLELSGSCTKVPVMFPAQSKFHSHWKVNYIINHLF